MEPIWVSHAMIRAIHAETIARFGGTAGMRDLTLQENGSGQSRKLLAHSEYRSIPRLAAGYCSGTVRNHPFVDGNKRAGILTAAMFLDLNGYDFDPNEAEPYTVIMALAAGETDDETLAVWIAENAAPREA